MKQLRNRGIALFLSMMMCLSLVTPVQAADCTAALTPSTNSVAQKNTDQTIQLTLSLSGSVTCSAFAYELSFPDELDVTSASLNGTAMTVTSIGGESVRLTYSGGNQVTTDNLGTIVVTIPADTKPGSYDVNVDYDEDYGVYVQFNTQNTVTSVAGATIQVTEAAAEPVVPAGSYAAAVSAPASATVGDTDVAFTIQVSGDSFASSQLAFTYDHSRLALKSVTPGSWNETGDGTVTVVEYGTANTTPHTYTAVFEALADGNASVTLNSACFGKAESADSENAAAAEITTASASVEIAKRSFRVTLPDIFTGANTVVEGENYIFAPADNANYNYSNVKVSMNGGEAQLLTAAADGSYTVNTVTGDLVITGERTAKRYTITFVINGNDAAATTDTVTYGTDYTFTIPSETNYDTTVTGIKIGETSVEAGEDYTIADDKVTIPGSKITGNILVNMTRSRNNATVTMSGLAAGLLSGSATAEPGKDYTVTLNRDNRYTYVVTATVNGVNVDLTENGDQYTIAGSQIGAGDSVEFSVTKTLRTDKLSVARYLQVDGAVLYLVKNSVARESTNVYVYDGTEMFWSAKYNAYCCLVIADTLDEAKNGVLELEEGTDTALSYSMDANLSGKVDINDAQFVHNLYNARYSSFTAGATMEKMLCADTNGDGIVNVSDAQMIVNHILGK